MGGVPVVKFLNHRGMELFAHVFVRVRDFVTITLTFNDVKETSRHTVLNSLKYG